jgi:hypothetical protein
MLFGQIFRHKNYRVTVWLKSASIQFLKPARTDLYYKIQITDAMISEAETTLNATGIFVKTYSIALRTKSGELCAVAKNDIYIKKIV